MRKNRIIVGVKAMAYGRHELFKYWVQHMNRLGLPTVVASNEEKIRELCRGHVHFVYAPNKPLGNKANIALKALRKYKVDYVLALGMDDFISDNFLQAYMPYMMRGIDYIGVTDCYHYDLKNDVFGYSPGYKGAREGETLGLGRCLSRRILDKLNWTMYDPNKHRTLDKTFTDRISKIKHTSIALRQRELGIYGVDVKDGHNINAFSIIKTYECERIPIPELKLIHNEKSVICAST